MILSHSHKVLEYENLSENLREAQNLEMKKVDAT